MTAAGVVLVVAATIAALATLVLLVVTLKLLYPGKLPVPAVEVCLWCGAEVPGGRVDAGAVWDGAGAARPDAGVA